MNNMTHHYKLTEGEWCMQFKFSNDSSSNDSSWSEVYNWFDKTFTKDEAWMGWNSNHSTLTVFFIREQAYAFSILKWA